MIDMLSINEAIAKYKEITNTDANCPIHCMRSCDKCVQESGQLSEWLEELKEYQEISKKNPFLVDMIKHDKIVRNKAIDDFVNACKEDILCQTFGLHIKGIEGIAQQLKESGKNE